MRFLFLTDTHVRGTSPAGRTDNFPEAIFGKLTWAVQKANELGVDAILHGGDLFDTESPSDDVAGAVGDILVQAAMPIFVVPGNHELYGYQIRSLPHTKLGLLARCLPNLRILSRDTGVVKIGDVELVGQEYHPHIDHSRPEDFIHGGDGDYRILIYHGQLMDRAPGFEMAHTLIEDVTTDAHLVVAGHYHPGWHPVRRVRQGGGHVLFWNPGSVARNEAQSYNMNRIPDVLLIETTDDKNNPFSVIPIPIEVARPGSEVLTRTHLDARDERANATALFRNAIRQAQEQLGDLGVIDVAAQGVPDDVRMRALEAVGKIPAERPDTPHRRLHRAKLTGFQSHLKSVIEFSPRITALVGESNAGKSAVLRAIRWAAYDQPRGSGFLRADGKSVEVVLEMTNGQTIERTRTASSAGILKINGEEHKGFTRALPPTLMQTHGMVPVEVQGLTLYPSVAAQTEGPFLLSLSPPQRAIAISPLGGSERIDAAAKQLSSDRLRQATAMRQTQDSLDTAERQLLALGNWQERLETLQKAMRLAEQVEEKQRKLSHLNDLAIRIRQAEERRLRLYDRIWSQPSPEKIEHLCISLVTLQQRRDAVGVLCTRVAMIKRDKMDLDGSKGLDHRPLLNAIKTKETLREVVDTLRHRVLAVVAARQSAEEIMAETDRQVKKLQAELKQLAEAGAVCPTCGKPIRQGAI